MHINKLCRRQSACSKKSIQLQVPSRANLLGSRMSATVYHADPVKFNCSHLKCLPCVVQYFHLAPPFPFLEHTTVRQSFHLEDFSRCTQPHPGQSSPQLENAPLGDDLSKLLTFIRLCRTYHEFPSCSLGEQPPPAAILTTRLNCVVTISIDLVQPCNIAMA